MFFRALMLVAGLTSGAGLSQFPEYSQQYAQRLAGAVDELSRFVEEFDADAVANGLNREEALDELANGGIMGAARAETMSTTLKRHDRLTADLQELRDVGPFTRAYNASRFTDGEIAKAAWADFKPAMPLTFEGIVFAAVGFIASLGVISAFAGLLRLLFRRKRRV